MTEINEKWPIEEAVCLIQFQPSKQWDLTAFGKFYSKIEEEYPNKTELTIIKNVADDSINGIEEDLCEEEILMRFTNDDGDKIVQLSQNTLIVNQLPDYPRWETFKPIILERVNDYCNSFNPAGIVVLKLRYINKFEEAEDKFDIEELFGKNRFFPGIVFEKKSQFMMHLDFANGQDYITEINAGFVKADKEEDIAIVFDIEVSSTKGFDMQETLLSEKLDEFHRRINEIFKGCISEKLKKLYNINKE